MAARFTLQTQDEDRKDPTPDQIRAAVARAQEEDGGFAVLSRDDGVFVQVAGDLLEYGRGERIHRAERGGSESSAEDVFLRFARGAEPEGDVPWRDVTSQVSREGRHASLRYAAILALVAAVVLVVGWLLLT